MRETNADAKVFITRPLAAFQAVQQCEESPLEIITNDLI